MKCNFFLLVFVVVHSIDLALLKSQTRDLFLHSYDSYISYSYPKDELSPLTCTGRGPTVNVQDYAINDVCGDYLLTLVDTLDTLAVDRIIDRQRFREAVHLAIHDLDFNKDVQIQVFEGTIRILGGLLSADKYAQDLLPDYKGELVVLAKEFADRLLPAFNTSTGIPYPRVNLKHGLNGVVVSSTCSAAAGSLVLEFGELSRVTGDPIYEKLAKRAFFAIWDRRSDINLVGDTINPVNGEWTTMLTGIGAGVDSFYEYALKAYVLFGDPDYYSVWTLSLEAIQKYIINSQLGLYEFVDVRYGYWHLHFIDSLSAFFPGLLVLDGHYNLAEQGWEVYAALWKKFKGIPERWNFVNRTIEHPGYPLRPEFVESTYYLYQTMKDPKYLYVGQRILYDLMELQVHCGVAGVKDLLKNELNDRMDSYFLSETLKYLYLLFDTENPLNKDDRVIFTTEGHPLWVHDSEYMPYPKCCAVPNNNFRHPREEKIWYVIGVPHDYSHANSICPTFQDKNKGIELTFKGTKVPDAVQSLNINAVLVASLDGQSVMFEVANRRLYITKVGDTAVPLDNSVWLLQSHYHPNDMFSFSEPEFVTLISEYKFHICTTPTDHVIPSGLHPIIALNDTACSPLPYTLIKDHIVVVFRGECDFSTKSNNAFGAKMIVVTDGNIEGFRIIPRVDQGKVPLILCGDLGNLGTTAEVGSKKKVMYIKGREVWNLVAD